MVERTSLPDLVASLTSGAPRFAIAELAALPRAATAVDNRYPHVFGQGRTRPAVAAGGAVHLSAAPHAERHDGSGVVQLEPIRAARGPVLVGLVATGATTPAWGAGRQHAGAAWPCHEPRPGVGHGGEVRVVSTDPEVTDPEVTDNAAASRYEARLDGGPAVAGFAQYIRTQELIAFVHTEVDPSYAGRGVGSALARGALDAARSGGLRVLAVCPFISDWISGHPGYADLLYQNRSKVSD